MDILTRNKRCCVAIETEEFGMVLFFAIGATDVGTVRYVLELKIIITVIRLLTMAG